MVAISKSLKLTAIIIIIGVVSVSIVCFGIIPLFFGVNGNENIKEDINEEFEILAQGELEMMDSVHKGSGTVQLINKGVGNYSIYFINVSIASGPDLYVYLSKKSSFSGIRDTPGEYIDLGELPALSGTFEVEISNYMGLISDYKSVIIWCLPFSVVFTYASLNPI